MGVCGIRRLALVTLARVEKQPQTLYSHRAAQHNFFQGNGNENNLCAAYKMLEGLWYQGKSCVTANKVLACDFVL